MRAVVDCLLANDGDRLRRSRGMFGNRGDMISVPVIADKSSQGLTCT